jgi:hypothetical protein
MVAGSARAGTAQWEFNGTLASSTGQPALTPTGYPGVAGAPGVTYENAMIQGAEAQVARITRGTALAVLHGFPSNGGGGYLNQYTIILDASFPGIGEWISLYQTNEAYDDAAGHFDLSDSNDGDLFIDPDGQVGISGVYGGTLTVNTWYRIALVVDLVAGTLTTYADGVQIQQLTGQGLDGRFALYTSTDPDPYDWFFLFADETEGRPKWEKCWSTASSSATQRWRRRKSPRSAGRPPGNRRPTAGLRRGATSPRTSTTSRTTRLWMRRVGSESTPTRRSRTPSGRSEIPVAVESPHVERYGLNGQVRHLGLGRRGNGQHGRFGDVP